MSRIGAANTYSLVIAVYGDFRYVSSLSLAEKILLDFISVSELHFEVKRLF